MSIGQITAPNSEPEAAARTVSRQMCVALFSPCWPPGTISNGVVSYVSRLQPELIRHGHEAIVLTLDCADGCEDVCVARCSAGTNIAGRLVNGVGRMFGRDYPFIRYDLIGLRRAIARLRKNRGIQLIEMEESFGRAGDLVGKTNSVPIVVRLHGPWFLNGRANGVAEDRAYRQRVELEGQAIRNAAAVSAPSLAVLNAVRDFYGLALCDAEVIPNPIEPVPQAHRWQPNRHVNSTVVFVGRFDRHKGGDVMLRAFERILSRCPQAQLIFVGPDEGLFVDSNAKLNGREFAQRHLSANAGRAIQWMGRQCFDAVDEHRLRGAVTVVASRFENFPYTLVEAMRLGCPVVATRTGGIPEVVEHGRSGLLATPNDADDLADKVLELLANRQLAASLGKNAADDVDSRFHPRVVAEQMMAFYRRVIDRSEGCQG